MGKIQVFNPFTPESDQCQISPAASQEIWHHTVRRTWLFIAYSDEKWLYYKFSLHHSYNRFLKGWENTLFQLRSERVKWAPLSIRPTPLEGKRRNNPPPPRFMIELSGYACMSFENVKYVCVWCVIVCDVWLCVCVWLCVWLCVCVCDVWLCVCDVWLCVCDCVFGLCDVWLCVCVCDLWLCVCMGAENLVEMMSE